MENIWVRLSFYIATRVILLAVICLFLFFAGITAYDTTTAYIILNDGLNSRAEFILSNKNSDHLDVFFEKSVIDSFMPIKAEYQHIRIDTYDYDLRIKWIFPWQNTARAIIKDDVVDLQLRQNEDDDKYVFIPEWDNRQKTVTLEKIRGKWLIVGIEPE